MASKKPEIVLVPGAWHYPHHLDLLNDRLQALGYKTHSVALSSVTSTPSRGDHQDDANVIRAVIQPLAEAGVKIVIFVHSYGGVPVSEAVKDLITTKGSDKGGVVHVVACNALVLQSGESLADAVQRAGPPEQWFDVDDKGLATVHKDKGAGMFYQPGVDDKTAQDAFSTIGQHRAMSFASKLVYSAWRDVPLTYINSSEDACVTPKCQQMMLDAIPDVHVVKTHGGHSPFLSHPDWVAEVIQGVA